MFLPIFSLLMIESKASRVWGQSDSQKCSVNKLKKKVSPEEIQEDKDILNQALLEKEEAEEWLDPQTAIDKLILILEE